MVKRNRLLTKRFLPAFTLAEVLIAMLVMSLFFMATTKVMSIRQKPLVQEYPHGYYECYNLNGLKEHRVDGGTETIPRNSAVGRCRFMAPKGLPVFNIYIAHTNRGFYYTTETQVNADDGMIFSGADNLISLYMETMDTEQDRNNAFYGNLDDRFAQFRNYLKNSYPQSMLGSNWPAGSNRPPFNAVFITW